MQKANNSILDQARAEGARNNAAQMSMLHHDEGYEEGYLDGKAEAPSRLLWFIIGQLAAVVLTRIF